MDGLVTRPILSPLLDLKDAPDAVPEKTVHPQAQEPGSSSVSCGGREGALETERADLLRGLSPNWKRLVDIWWVCIRTEAKPSGTGSQSF